MSGNETGCSSFLGPCNMVSVILPFPLPPPSLSALRNVKQLWNTLIRERVAFSRALVPFPKKVSTASAHSYIWKSPLQSVSASRSSPSCNSIQLAMYESERISLRDKLRKSMESLLDRRYATQVSKRMGFVTWMISRKVYSIEYYSIDFLILK